MVAIESKCFIAASVEEAKASKLHRFRKALMAALFTTIILSSSSVLAQAPYRLLHDGKQVYYPLQLTPWWNPEHRAADGAGVKVIRAREDYNGFYFDPEGDHFVFWGPQDTLANDNDAENAATTLDFFLREMGMSCILLGDTAEVMNDGVTGERDIFQALSNCSTPGAITFRDAMLNYWRYETSGHISGEGFPDDMVVPVRYFSTSDTTPWWDPVKMVTRTQHCYRSGGIWRDCYRPSSDLVPNRFAFYSEYGTSNAEEWENSKMSFLDYWNSRGQFEAYCPYDMNEVWGDRPYAQWLYDFGGRPVNDGNTWTGRHIYRPCLDGDTGSVHVSPPAPTEAEIRAELLARLPRVTAVGDWGDNGTPDGTIGPEFIVSLTGERVDAYLRGALGLPPKADADLSLDDPSFGHFFDDLTYYDIWLLPPEMDADGDWMPDAYENLHDCLMANTVDGEVDFDGDGLKNIEEFSIGTNPCNTDSDGDALPDGWEHQYSSCSFYPGYLYSEVDPPQQIGTEMTIVQNIGDAEGVEISVAWTGSEYGVSWQDSRNGKTEIYFRRLAPDGSALGPEVRVTYAEEISHKPQMAWTGSEFGLTWYDGRNQVWDIYFARVSAEGNKIGSDQRVTSTWLDDIFPSLAWTGSEFGIAWSDNRNVYFTRLGADGSKVGDDTLVNMGWREAFPYLQWTGSEFGVLWRRTTVIGAYFQRLSETGLTLGPITEMFTELLYNSRPAMAWTGFQFSVIGTGYDIYSYPFQISFQPISAAGEATGLGHLVRDSDVQAMNPGLAWSGSAYGAVWIDDGGSYLGRPKFAFLSASGFKIGDEIAATMDCYDCYPVVVWTGSEFGMFWEQYDLPGAKIKFARISSGRFFDKDNDQLSDYEEYRLGTNPCETDTDGDLYLDGEDCGPNNPDVFPLAPELCDALDNQCPGDPGFGFVDEGCPQLDSDGDGLLNTEEDTIGTNPLFWDSDGDGISDYIEHYTPGLDPLDPADALLDFDADRNPNLQEVHNGTGMNTPDPQGHFGHPQLGCSYWTDADGDGLLAPTDLALLQNVLLGLGGDYSNVIPPAGFTQDADGNGEIGPGDLSEVNNMILGLPLPYIGGRADSLVVLDSPAGPVAAGDTCRVTIGVLNEANLGYAQGFAVIFEVVSGDATLMGGDGSASFASPGNRYDFSGAAGSPSMVIRPNSSGTVVIDAHIPACGTLGLGRSCAEIVLAAPISITVP